MKLTHRIALVPTLFCATATLVACSTTAPDLSRPMALQERADFKRHFDAAGTDGTLLIYDVKKGVAHVHNASRARTAFVPASTFKVTNSLIALESGAVRDVDTETFSYSGEPFMVRGKPFLPPQCNEAVTLRTAFKFSCIPVYQEVARRVGIDKYRETLARLPYGQGDMSGQRVDWFWLEESGYKISTEQQVQFLTRFYRGKLPYSARTQDMVKHIMVVEREAQYTLRAKTGYLYSTTPELGWYVGWLEKGEDAYVFALNLDMAKPEHARARAVIVKAGLKDIGAL